MAGSYFPYGCHGNFDEDDALLRERGAYVTCAYRSCGLTFKTLETLERHVRLQHNLTWDAYTRYISGNNEDGEEEDETNSKKRDAYCICTYLECGRKFKMLKSLEEHVTLYHNISWQNYTMYYHRLGKEGPDSTEDNSTGSSGPKTALSTKEVTKVPEEPHKGPQKSVAQPSTRGPVIKAPSCADVVNKPPSLTAEQLSQTALTANDMYAYMANVAPAQYYQDYSLLSPYIGAIPAVMADPWLWGYVTPTALPDVTTQEQNPMNLAKSSQGQMSRSTMRPCDVPRSNPRSCDGSKSNPRSYDMSESNSRLYDLSRLKSQYESNNPTGYYQNTNVAQNNYAVSSKQSRFEGSLQLNCDKTSSRNAYDTCRNVAESRFATHDTLSQTKNDSSFLSSNRVSFSKYDRYLEQSQCSEDSLFGDEGMLPKKKDGVIVIEPRVCVNKKFQAYQSESAEIPARDVNDRGTEACRDFLLSSTKHDRDNQDAKSVPERDILDTKNIPERGILTPASHVGRPLATIGALHPGTPCDQFDHVTKDSCPQKEEKIDVSKRCGFLGTSAHVPSRMNNSVYVMYIRTRYKFWHQVHRRISYGELVQNKIKKKYGHRKVKSYHGHKSSYKKILSCTWENVITRYRTAMKSYKSRTTSFRGRYTEARAKPGRSGNFRKMKWGSLGCSQKKNNIGDESEESPLAREMEFEAKEDEGLSEMPEESQKDISKVNEDFEEQDGPLRKSSDTTDDGSDSSSPLNMDAVDPFALNEPREQNETMVCGQCRQSSLTASAFVRHLLTQHSMLRCVLCLRKCPHGGNIYRFEETLKRHLEDFHEINCEDDQTLAKHLRKTTFAGKELKGLHSIEDTDLVLAITNEKIYFWTGVAMSYKVCTTLPPGEKEDDLASYLEITGIFTCKAVADGEARTSPASTGTNAETSSIPPRPPEGSEDTNNMADQSALLRSISTDSADPEEPKLVIAESESCDSFSSNSNSENVRYKGPKKRFLEGLKTVDSSKSDSAPAAVKPKNSFNLRHCINQIIDSDIVRSKLLSRDDSPGISQVSSPSVTAPASLDNTPAPSPSAANPAIARTEPASSPQVTPSVRAGVKVRDIIQESVTASVGGGNAIQSDKGTNEKGGNPLLQMAALASMLPRQPVPSREGTPVAASSSLAAVPLTATTKADHPRTIAEVPSQQFGVIHHKQYVAPQPDQRYYAQEPVNVVPQQRSAPAPRRTEQTPARYPGPPPPLSSPAPKAVEMPRTIDAQRQAYISASKPQQYRNASPKQQQVAQSQRYSTHQVAAAAAAAPAVSLKGDLNAVMAPASIPLVAAGYIYPQAAPFSAVSMTVEKETPLDLSKKTTIEEEPIIISDDQPLDLSVKPTKMTSHSSSIQRTHSSYSPHPTQGAVVKAAQTWYPRDQSGSSQNSPSRYAHMQDARQHPSGNGTAMRSVDPNLARLQPTNRGFKAADLSGRSPMGISGSGNTARAGHVRPMVAEVRPIVSQTKAHPNHARQVYHSEKGRVVSPHAAGMPQASYATSASHSPGHGGRTHSPSHSNASHLSGYGAGNHSPGRSAVMGYSNVSRTTSAGFPQGHSHSGHSVSASQSHALQTQQEQFLRQVAQHREIPVSREMLSPREQQMNMAAVAAHMRPRTTSSASLLGNHPLDDILYLKCNVCSSTYGSLHSFKKHFSKAHGFEPRPENVTVRSISAAKEDSKPDPPQLGGSKYQYVQAGGQPHSPTYRASPTGSNLSSPGVPGMDHSSPGPRVSPSPHGRHPEMKSDPPKLDAASPAGSSQSGRTVMQCFQCGQDFPTRDWGVFKRHMRAHEMPQLRCNICRQTFRDEQEFRDHNLTYHPVQNYPCRTCGVSFGHPAALSKHVKMVHAESPEPDAPNLQCLYCPHCFNSLADFKTHIQEHERLLGISSKDSSVAQHSPQIRRASPDSTNDLEEGHTCSEEKTVKASNSEGSSPTSSRPRSQGIPIFNLTPSVPPSNENRGSFRSMSIMDIVREKVEEASRKYLFDICNKTEEKEDTITRDADGKGNKEIAIKQELSMEVKQEIGDKIYVMNYQEKGTVKESHIDDPSTHSASKDSLKTEVDRTTESDQKDWSGQPTLKVDSGDSTASKNDTNKEDNDKVQVCKEETGEKPLNSLTPIETLTNPENSATSGESVPNGSFPKQEADKNGEQMEDHPAHIAPKELADGEKSKQVEDGMSSNAQEVSVSDNHSLQPGPQKINEMPSNLSQNAEVSPIPSDALHNDEPQGTPQVSALKENASTPVAAPSSGGPSNGGTPAALMFDDSDTEDDDDGGSKLVICENTDPDDAKDEAAENGSDASAAMKRPLQDNDGRSSPKRLKTCQTGTENDFEHIN